LKLRESKAIERKVERTREREKQAAKEERRRLREEADTAKTEENAEKEENKLSQEEEELGLGLGVNIQEKDLMPDANNSDEEDPFLKAIGARDISSLTGEAYQKYLLSKESK
jgi:outer membrane protein TolC